MRTENSENEVQMPKQMRKTASGISILARLRSEGMLTDLGFEENMYVVRNPSLVQGGVKHVFM